MAESKRKKRGAGKEVPGGRELAVAGASSAADPVSFRSAALQFLEDNDIVQEIRRSTVNTHSTIGARFITEHSLSQIWPSPILARFLACLGYGGDSGLVDKVARKLLKTISILVSIRWSKWENFGPLFLEPRPGTIRHDRTDAALPYALKDLQDNSFLGLWGDEFFQTQNVYLPLVIEERSNEIFPRTRPLPFILSKTEEIGKGGYGLVTKEVIAAYQFKPFSKWKTQERSVDEVAVARKWFQAAKGDFHKEAKILADFNKSLSRHTRIVRYLAMFTIEEDQWASKQFSILLPLAETDLKKFLYEEKYESWCSGIVEMVDEASNLADAIRWLHEGQAISKKVLVCCHMDLKLDNILVYPDESDQPSSVGLWKISDFGISSMTEREPRAMGSLGPSSALLQVPSPAAALASITGTVQAYVQRPSGPYSAPEYQSGQKVGPKADIFSYGCILFQVLARGAGGIEELKKLDAQRGSMKNGSTNDHFCQRGGIQGPRLHSSVTDWLKSPYKVPNGTFKDRDVVESCKRLIEQALSINPKDRPDAAKLHTRLLRIASGEISYASDHAENSTSPSPTPQEGNKPVTLRPAPQIQITPSAQVPQDAATSEHLKQGSHGSAFTFPISPPANNDHVTPPIFQVQRRPPTPPPDEQDQASSPQQHRPPARSATMSRGPIHVPPPLSNFNIPARSETLPISHGQRHSLDRFQDTSPILPQEETHLFSSRQSRHSSQNTVVPEVEIRKGSKGNTMPFHVKNATSALISSTRAKIAFISPKVASLFTLYSPYSTVPIEAPTDYVWERGSLAGDFLVLKGSHKDQSQQIFGFYKLRVHLIEKELVVEPFPLRQLSTVDKFAVSRNGKLLLGASKKVWLCQSFDGQADQLDVQSEELGNLQQVWFSTDGLLAFARFLLRNNVHLVRIWDVSNHRAAPVVLEYQVPPGERNSPTPISNWIHFPRSKACLLWLANNNLMILQTPQLRSSPSELTLANLQAAVVTPNEKAVILITFHKKWGVVPVSEISIAKIESHDGYMVLGTRSRPEALTHHLEKPKDCDIVVEEHTSVNGQVRVLIGHPNSAFEVKYIMFPT